MGQRDLSSPCRRADGEHALTTTCHRPVPSAVPPGPPWATWPPRTCGATGAARRKRWAAGKEGGQGEYPQLLHPRALVSLGTGTLPCRDFLLLFVPLSSSPRLDGGSPGKTSPACAVLWTPRTSSAWGTGGVWQSWDAPGAGTMLLSPTGISRSRWDTRKPRTPWEPRIPWPASEWGCPPGFAAGGVGSSHHPACPACSLSQTLHTPALCQGGFP